MRIYFAGVDRPSFLPILWENGARNILISYADYRKSFAKFSEHLSNYQFNILLDSGAYSAFTRGIKLDVREYADFLLEFGDWFEHCFNLDVIGDYEASWENQRYLESRGLKPVPVVHYGEEPGLVEQLGKEYDLVALGGMVPMSTRELDEWLREVFYGADGNLRNLPKLHGLGLTTKSLLKKYRFYSSDSTGWLVGKKFGRIINDTGTSIKVNRENQTDLFSSNLNWYLKMEKEINKSPVKQQTQVITLF